MGKLIKITQPSNALHRIWMNKAFQKKSPAFDGDFY